jgi:hypothetical protein
MSKQLGAILNRVPPATATARPAAPAPAPAPVKATPAPPAKGREVPLQVLVPEHIRKQLGAMANDEHTSLRALVLRAVRSLGIEVSNEEIKDKRGRRS